MVVSMTGYGKSLAEYKGFIFEVEVKSLNNRFLEISVKLPHSLQSKEYEIREVVKSKLKRGKIYVNIGVKQEGGEGTSVMLNETKLKDTLTVLQKINEINGSKEPVSLTHILTFKELFSPELELLDDAHITVLKKAIEEALESLNAMRAREGEALLDDIRGRLNSISDAVTKIEAVCRISVLEHFEKFKERARDMVQEFTSNPERLDFELAILSEKSDISEECTRLKSHINMFNSILSDNAEAGRKLNFLCQELHREANTIASKSLSSDVVHYSLTIREEIERIREQVQNIE